MAFRCATCKEEHEGLPDLGMERPDAYFGIPEAEREERVWFTSDLCAITYDDQTDYFIRGVLYLPIRGEEHAFGIGVWVSQSKENFERYLEGEEDMEPTFGWLANRVSFYDQETLALKTNVHFQDGKVRPFIELEPTDHPFAVDQREGITLEKAWKIVHRYMD